MKIKFQNHFYSEEQIQDLTNAKKVELYNQVAEVIGEKPVKKFADTKTANRRTWKILQDYKALKQSGAIDGEQDDDEGESEPEAPKDKKGRAMHFRFEKAEKVTPPRSPNSLRGQCVELLRDGAKFEDVKNLVEKFDNDRGVAHKNVERRAYELVRLLHYYLGYGMTHDLSTGIIKLKE